MDLDLEGQLADQAYPILASLVVPRPTGVSDRPHGISALVLPNRDRFELIRPA